MAQVNQTQKKQRTSESNDDLYVKIPLLIFGLLLGCNLLILRLLLNQNDFCGLTTGMGPSKDATIGSIIGIFPFYFFQFLGSLVIAFALGYTNLMNAKRIVPQLFRIVFNAIFLFILIFFISIYYAGFYCWIYG